MNRRPRLTLFILTVFLIGLTLITCSKKDPFIQELIEKNIQSAGGPEKIAQIKNYSFKAGGKTYYLSEAGQMKIISGDDPIITEAVLVAQGDAKRNSYNQLSNFENLQKYTQLSLAKLRSGLFTLDKFQDQLEYLGLKKFGPREHHQLTTREGDLEIHFYIDSTDFSLKRAVFQGFDDEQGKYEINHDYSLLQEIDGINIPSSWFSSQLGVTRGSLIEVSDVTFNLPLEKDFFSSCEVNVGEVQISEGSLTGNIISSRFMRGRLQINTNWTKKSIQGAGFKAGDKLILGLPDQEIEVDFYDSSPPRNAYETGSKLMMPNRRDSNYIIIFSSPEFEGLAESLEPLSSIKMERK